MKEDRVLVVDDQRHPENADAIAKTAAEAIELLRQGPWGLLLIDHDLGDIDRTTGREYTGYDVLCWLEQNPEYLPDDMAFGILSSNPVGRDRMRQVIVKLKHIQDQRKKEDGRR